MMNRDAYLHAHIQARYAWEPEEYRRGPVWNNPAARLCDDSCYWADAKFTALKERITTALRARLSDIGYWEDDA